MQRANTEDIQAEVAGKTEQVAKADARKEYKARKERFYRSMKSRGPIGSLRALWLRREDPW